MTEELEQEYVIVGLGNPGKKYELTRHNMGFIVLKALAQEKGWTFKEESKFHSLVASGNINHTKVHLLLPLTFMNESGRAVRAFINFYKLAPAHVFVVSDDAELELGAIRLRPTGSSGGHNGLKSVEAHLGTKHYARLRLGIGRSKERGDLIDYVLDEFNQEEQAQLPAIVKRAVEALKQMTTSGIAAAMQSVNARIKSERPIELGPGEQKA